MPSTAALYDDTYHGARWRYGLLHRPLANYFNLSFPDPILFSDRPDPRFPYYGTADWPCEIPEEEARHHSLVLLGVVDDGLSDEYPNLTASLQKAEG